MYKQLSVDVSLRADQISFLQFLLQTERSKILRDCPTALYDASPGSWAASVDELHSLFTYLSDSNLSPLS